jgi:dipeptide/tripeptide permease
MPYIVGAAIALTVAALGRLLNFERDRSFYATILLVIASYYVLFAAMAGSTPALITETAVMSVFVLLAAFGALRTRWVLVLGLALHGVFDLVHPRLIENAGVPSWWPQFCLAFDLAAAAYVAFTLATNRVRSQEP